jgi:adenylate cyclase
VAARHRSPLKRASAPRGRGNAKSLAEPLAALPTRSGAWRPATCAKVRAEDGSDVGMLQSGFNRMVGGLRELMEDLFSRHVGENVAREAWRATRDWAA